MSRILFSLFSNINWLGASPIDPFYEGFINSLIEQGNQVMLIRTNEFLSSTQDNQVLDSIDSKKIIKKVIEFNPDLIIAANNHIPQVILENTDKPILLWASDSPVWYANKKYIKEHIKRYRFFHHGWNEVHNKICKDEFNATLDQNFNIGHVTAVKSKTCQIVSNITFVGTVGYTRNIVDYLKHCCDNKELQKLKKFYLDFIKSPLRDIATNYNNHLHVIDFLYLMTSNNRIKVLDSLTDLGLKVYGYHLNFFDVTPFAADLAFCFDYTPVTSILDTENVFNSSKIGLHLYSAHAGSGFSWRVPDIMASNACLVSPNQPDLLKFNPYIKMPTFNSPQEARDICKKLLEDENWRKEIVASSHKAIEEHGRFEHKFKIIEEVFNVKLLLNHSNEKKAGERIILNFEDCIKDLYKPSHFVYNKMQASFILKKRIRIIFISLIKLLPRRILKKIYEFLLSIRHDLN
jgi:hypothetical protein